MQIPADLPVGYYRDNFLALVDFVREQYGDILTQDEIAYADSFIDLSLNAQRLYVRLISRRGPLFRSDKLSYAGDRLQDNQKRWIRAFERFGMPYRVINVEWS